MGDKKKLEAWFDTLNEDGRTRATREAVEKSRLDSATRDSLAQQGLLGETSDDEVVKFLKTRHD